jgi:glycine betaine/choline ABC-type transport system substrate-binding protein
MQIQQLSLIALYFVYGLSFNSMGIAIAFQYRSFSNFRLEAVYNYTTDGNSPFLV